ncbi:MAG: NADH-quinone oxidoreductase subunit J [Syntrophobacterales bacterium CG_4_8_14_3_um_filter_58_8]|nr:MAG: NADH-quinone oxidoreductase subunit J [Syntrophaceae bacterium CG2_30_58_14]PIV06019.1 MAG: NADH-quinone oxidoreductase subunit J [Syntrophobacterales bacterium CG03_land_8_20_14_0_80_58_14]PJC71969.1 MAG: NADH-quinone oxidoreductase subunit J [Syntrophobacterales bacterium CG_4_8_14_3_um_filter_58_8]
MTDFIFGHYVYWSIIALLIIGLYGMIFKNNLAKKLIGMTIFQVSIIMFYVASAVKWSATVPVLDPVTGVVDAAKYISPLQHCLMLTAIVVGVATSGVAFSLAIVIYRHYKTLDESVLMERMKSS